jgi:ribose-phosphate pyrophosphokinase
MERLLLTTEQDAKGYEQIDVHSFPDGDSYVRLPSSPKGKQAIIFSRCYPNQNNKLLELLLAISTAKELGASPVRAFIPYLPYARQDKRVKDGEAISANVLCGLLKAAGLDELITLDCHFLKKSGMFEYGGLSIANLSASPAMLEAAKKGLKLPLVITPDQGAAYLAKGEAGAQSMVKERGEYQAGTSSKNKKGAIANKIYRPVASLTADFSVKGRDVIIVDDIVAGGSTMLKAVQLCKKGHAHSITCVCTHGQLLDHADRKILAAGARRIISTDSIISKYSVVKVLEVARDAL